MKDTIEQLRRSGGERIAAADDTDQLEAVRVALLGRKGELTGLLRALKEVDAAERPAAGADLNRLKNELSGLLDARQAELAGSVVSGAANCSA